MADQSKNEDCGKDNTDGRNFDGYENIRNWQDYFQKYGELADETLQEWVREKSLSGTVSRSS